MNAIDKELDKRLDDTYRRISLYLKKDFPKLKNMCEACECWYGDEHNYYDCKDKPCFRFFLAYEYSRYSISWEINPDC